MAFHDVRFPEDISYGSSGGPEFSTDIVITQGGFEQRNSNWAEARARFNVAHGVKTTSQLEELIAFFRARKGRAHAFRFKDWSDYVALGQPLGTGNGTTTQFQLRKTYTSSNSETRTISKPVASTVKIYVDGALTISGVSVNYSTGLVTFTTAPATGKILTADFEFDVPVRFDTDRLSATLEQYGVHSWADISLVEVRV